MIGSKNARMSIGNVQDLLLDKNDFTGSKFANP